MVIPLILNAAGMTFRWGGYPSNWQSAKVRAIVLIVIPPSVITQKHDRITVAVICAIYLLSGLCFMFLCCSAKVREIIAHMDLHSQYI